MVKKGLGRGLDALFSVYKSDEEEEKVDNKIVASLEASEKKDEPAEVKKPTEMTKVKEQAPIVTSVEGLKEVSAQGTTPSSSSESGVLEIDIKLIDPNKEQPRKSFNAVSLKELSESIKQHGVIQPIVVNDNNGRYLIIAGERRFRASIIAGLKTIPCVVKHYTERQIKEVSLIENLQREDLNAIEAARAIKKLMDEFNFTQETVADRIGKSRPAIANTLRLLALCPEVVAMIENNKLSAGHARCLVVVSNRDAQIELATAACDNKMTVRDLEKAVKEHLSPKANKKVKQQDQSIELKELINNMKRVFATKVSALGNDRRGRIYIDYYSRDDLDRISEILEMVKQKTPTEE